jgi:putative endonuclease
MREARRVQDSRGDRLARLRRGNIAELIAAGLLMAKGYRILARRHRTPYGEIDLIAARWRRIAFVEVKRRVTMAECEAALTPRQAERIGRAADHWLARHPRFREHEIGLDAILVVPGKLPRHLPNVLDQA